MAVLRRELTEGWILTSTGGPVPADIAPDIAADVSGGIAAVVPGCVHTDLLAAGLIDDPHDGANEGLLAWIGRVRWTYTTEITESAPLDGERLDLVCDGLDTIATVTVNGVVIGRTANQYRSHRFDLRPVLVAGVNTVEVSFDAALDYAERASEQYEPLFHVNDHPYNAIRKMACNYGWDWGPDVVTAGIWRPIALERWTDARIVSVRPLVDVRDGVGILTAHVELERACGDESEPLALELTIAEQTIDAAVCTGQTSIVVSAEIPDVALWWPRGYGEQPLYPVAVALTAGAPTAIAPAQRSLDGWHGAIGFRTVRLDLTPDADGIPFVLLVNDQRLFVKGANWIPDDSLVTRIDNAAYGRRFSQATGAGINLLRVWGGGLFESEDFYRLADERGVLVWQDFLFACAGYPEAEPLYSEVEAEAREAVTRLSQHPSLVLWNGGNEDIVAYAEWHGLREKLAGHPWGNGYYNDLLPRIVHELDPTRPYTANSPYSFGDFASPNEQHLGSVHIWDVWNQKDYTHYADWKPRFVAEFGFQGPPAWSTLTRVVHDEPLSPNGVQMLVHQKANEGNKKLESGLVQHLPVPATIDDWHWATQLNQARAVTFGIEHFRSLQPYCMGTIIWQLNDCWPVVSWSMIDGDEHKKPAWFALRNVYADHLLTIQPRGDGLTVVAINDTAQPWNTTLTLQRRTVDGRVLASATQAIVVAARLSVEVVIDQEVVPKHTTEVLAVDAATARRALWYPAEDINTGLPPPQLTSAVSREPHGYRVDVTAHGFVKDLALFPDRLDSRASVNECLITLFPGETASFFVTTVAELDEIRLTTFPVLRCANDLFLTGVPQASDSSAAGAYVTAAPRATDGCSDEDTSKEM
jgi:beta-mannosidase